MREDILAAGRVQYKVSEKFITDIFEDVIDINDISATPTPIPNSAYPMVGLALKNIPKRYLIPTG